MKRQEMEKALETGFNKQGRQLSESMRIKYLTALMTPEPKVIDYTPELNITNTKFLAPGLGLRFLECIASHVPGELIAKCWHREMPEQAEIVVKF